MRITVCDLAPPGVVCVVVAQDDSTFVNLPTRTSALMNLLGWLARLRKKLILALAVNLVIAIGIIIYELSVHASVTAELGVELSNSVDDDQVVGDNGQVVDQQNENYEANPIFSSVDDERPFNMTFDFLLKPGNKTVVDTKMLVLVYTVATDTDLRRQIRDSWGGTTEHDIDVRVEFLIGIPQHEVTSNLLEEQREFDDLVVVSFDDTYYNMAVKTFIALNYKNIAYSDAKCFVKADVDNVLMLRNFQHLCDENKGPVILGKCNVQRTVFRLRKFGKWAVPTNVYPWSFYPYYCSTGTYIMVGQHLPGDLQAIARRTKFPVSQNFRRLPEDMLFTGMFPDLLHVKRRHVGGMSFSYEADTLCRNDGLFTYAIHMSDTRNHTLHYNRLLNNEGVNC